MGKHTDRDQELHNKAEQDYVKRDYDPPHGIITSSDSWKNVEESEAYKSGWENARNQDPERSGCFLTTACVEHAGLRDDCHELTILRAFRDTFVINIPNGTELLAEYYEVAPHIVDAITKSPTRDLDLAAILSTVREAVRLIRNDQFYAALTLYEGMFSDLKRRYVL